MQRRSEYRSRATGITIFNKATLKLMLMELTDGEIKLYAYLYRMLNKKLEVIKIGGRSTYYCSNCQVQDE